MVTAYRKIMEETTQIVLVRSIDNKDNSLLSMGSIHITLWFNHDHDYQIIKISASLHRGFDKDNRYL